jgi:hypothetical protein
MVRRRRGALGLGHLFAAWAMPPFLGSLGIFHGLVCILGRICARIFGFWLKWQFGRAAWPGVWQGRADMLQSADFFGLRTVL